MVLRQASETGQLFGSVTTRDLAMLVADGGFQVNRTQIALNAPIKTIGQHKVPVALHPEVEVTIVVNVARNAEEAERVARGEDVTVRRTAAEEEREQAAANAEAFFEPGAKQGRGRRRGAGRRRRREEEGLTIDIVARYSVIPPRRKSGLPDLRTMMRMSSKPDIRQEGKVQSGISCTVGRHRAVPR